VAVEVGACAVGSGGVAGGEVGGRQGAGGGLEGQVASAAPPYPLLLFGGGLGACGGGRQREPAWSTTARWAVEHCCSCRARVWWRWRSSWQMLVG
jgi:hypothetical protein